MITLSLSKGGRLTMKTLSLPKVISIHQPRPNLTTFLAYQVWDCVVAEGLLAAV
jgi:hypothetical protein